MKKTIFIKELLNTDQVALRTTADIILAAIADKANSKKDVVLDFTNIKFISRSFTHGLISALSKLDSYQVSIVNMCSDVEGMFLLVKEQKDSKNFKKHREHLFPKDFDPANPVDFFSLA